MRAIILCLAFALACAGPAGAAEPDQIMSRTTELVSVTPPSGWVLSVWNGGTVELAEFTPPGQTGAAYIDLLGYSALPIMPRSGEALADYDQRWKAGCSNFVVRQAPRVSGWTDLQYVCLARDSGKPDLIEVEFATLKQGTQSVYRVWRSWRGTSGEFQAMLRDRLHIELSPVAGSGASMKVNQVQLDEALAALAPLFFADLARAEICDLADERPCHAFDRPFPPELQSYMPGKHEYVAALAASGMNRLTREQFREVMGARDKDDGSPNRIIVSLTPANIDWNDNAKVVRTITLVAYGQAADGGVLIATDPDKRLSRLERAKIATRIVIASRQLWKPGYSPDITYVSVPKP